MITYDEVPSNIDVQEILSPWEIVEYIYKDIIVWDKISENYIETIEDDSGKRDIKTENIYWYNKYYKYMVLTNQRLLLLENSSIKLEFCLDVEKLKSILIKNDIFDKELEKIRKETGTAKIILNSLFLINNSFGDKLREIEKERILHPPLLVITEIYERFHFFRKPYLVPSGGIFSIFLAFLFMKFGSDIKWANWAILLPISIFGFNINMWTGIAINKTYLVYGIRGTKAISFQKMLGRLSMTHIRMRKTDQAHDLFRRLSPRITAMEEVIRLHFASRIEGLDGNSPHP